ncbi:hypothetical protein SNE510_08240 [Streptomyces sp. NE5-10]|uniref:HAD-IA family hydrolase n=1 Tax=Streptomyces sp. NE5-10 TaxID=2759674 RepID=UPI001A3E247E|nr:hypothetical protein SNE510_08240 [Streptomyces sp. NE5-10]
MVEPARPAPRDAVDTGLDPVDGLPEALAALTLPTCVASSGSHAKMRRTLGRTGLYAHFDARIYSASEVTRGKPAPDLFLCAARRMGVDPAACAVVEDSGPGVAAALGGLALRPAPPSAPPPPARTAPPRPRRRPAMTPHPHRAPSRTRRPTAPTSPPSPPTPTAWPAPMSPPNSSATSRGTGSPSWATASPPA